MAEEKFKTLYKLRWLLIIIFVICVGCMTWFIETRLFFQWLIAIGVTAIIGCVTYSFAGAFTQVKWKKWIAVVLIIFGGLFWYYMVHREPSVVRMKEDVLYIRPNSSVDDLYDGSENDPNLRRDTINIQ